MNKTLPRFLHATSQIPLCVSLRLTLLSPVKLVVSTIPVRLYFHLLRRFWGAEHMLHRVSRGNSSPPGRHWHPKGIEVFGWSSSIMLVKWFGLLFDRLRLVVSCWRNQTKCKWKLTSLLLELLPGLIHRFGHLRLAWAQWLFQVPRFLPYDLRAWNS